MNSRWFCASALALVFATPAAAGTFTAGYSAPWLQQISLPSNVWAGTNGGSGVIIGVVDTGIVASNAEVAGRVLSASSCAAVSFQCANGVLDDNGHGTAVASIAAGAYNAATGAQMSGVAPGVTILSEKVLNASGSGYDTDVANGILKATAGGAQVINLSLTYAPTSREVAAINTAAAAGAVVVFAAGNDNAALNGGANTMGLTAAAVSHILFVGSVSATNVKSSFSNSPGSGGIVVGSKTTSYASLFLVAPGEKVIAPGIQYGATSYAYWSGTSMAAPIVAGSVAVLEKAWPVLVRNGTATSVLLATATDLGAPGVDPVYGAGLLNLTRAFQPVGALSAVGANGKSVALGSGTSAMVSSTTLGVLKGLGAALSSYTVFDSYSRNFTANLSALLGKPANASVSLSSLVYTPLWSSTAKLAGGGILEVARDATPAFGSVSMDHAAYGLAGFTPHAPSGYVAFSSPTGLMLSGGYGMTSVTAYGQALWGGAMAGREATDRLEISEALLGMAQGGYSANVGVPLNDRIRLGFGWSGTVQDRDLAAPYAMVSRRAQAMSAGVAASVSSRLGVSATVTALDERNGLLGAAYSPFSAVNLGDQHRSVSSSITAVYNLGRGMTLGFSAADATTPGQAINTGLLSRVSDLHARAYGMVVGFSGVAAASDHVSLWVRQPLQLTAGTADVAITTVDSDGYNHTSEVRTQLAGGPAETDLGMSYGLNLGAHTQLQTDLAWRSNVYRSAGLDDLAMRAVVRSRF